MKDANYIKNKSFLDRYFVLGTYVLVSVFINQRVNFIRWHDPLEILWFCDATAILLGIGLIVKNRMFLTLAMVTAIPAQAPWILDFFLEAFGHGMGRTAALFTFGHEVFWPSVHLHAIVIPIAVYAVWKLGFSTKALFPILAYIILLLGATFLFTEPSENRNCVFYDCDLSDPGSGYGKFFLTHSLLFWVAAMTASFHFFRYLFRKKLAVEKTQHSDQNPC